VRRAVVAVAVLLLAVASVASAQTAGAPSGGRFAVSAEALLWWLKDSPAPTPLVTDGVVGQPGTRVLLGGEDVGTSPSPGFRLSAGYSPDDRWGVESSVFYVPPRSTTASVASSGQPGSTNLFIPFFDVTTRRESTTGLARVASFAGSATEELRNSVLGAELSATMRLPAPGPLRVDALGGFRYLRLRETYTFSTSSPDVPPQPVDVFQTTDEFAATNNFFGLQAGARARMDRGAWFLSGVLKVALGAMVESVEIDGRLVTNDFTVFATPQTFAGGYFAQPAANMGKHTRSVFTVVPEVGLTLGYRVTPSLSVVAGYTFLYASNVVRAPEQINRNINPSAAPAFTGSPPAARSGPGEPTFKFNWSDFWAQGLNVGLALRF
jgi:hypothetical protein